MSVCNLDERRPRRVAIRAREITEIDVAAHLHRGVAMTRPTMIALMFVSVVATSCTDPSVGFTPDVDDETVDPSDPPIEPDPIDPAELLAPDDTVVGAIPSAEDIPTDAELAEVPSDAELAVMRSACPKQTRTLSPKGLTFAIHISKKEGHGWAAYHQLRAIRHLIRARDIFVIERDALWVRALRHHFPCNEFHFIAYPDELANAYAAAPVVDGIIVDWEGGAVDVNGAYYSIEKLGGYADKIHGKGLGAAVAPAFPQTYNDGHIVRASHMNFDLAQIQGSCKDGGAVRFAALARSLVVNFLRADESPRNLGVEISLDSVSYADNHTDVDRSVACSRKAYGKGARAIYIYGNGPPHLTAYFHALRDAGLRDAR